MVLARLMVMLVMVVVVMLAGHARGDGKDLVAMKALRAKLLNNYDKETMPLVEPGPIVVNISGFVIRRLEMDERKHQVNLFGWITFTWFDSRFAWEPNDYGKLDKLSLPTKDVWLPDLSVYNAAKADATPISPSELHVIVYPTGMVLQVPPLQLVYDCAADLTYWPHDTHLCKLTIGSWVHDGFLISFVLDDSLKVTQEPEPKDGMRSLQWRIDEASVIRPKDKFYSCCEEPYVSVETSLKIVRDAPAYTWFIKIPAVCFSLLTLVIFLLPPDAGEKITFGGVCLLLHLVFLVFAHDTVCSAPMHTPLIVQLVVVELVLVAASVVVAAAVVRMTKTPNTTPPPSSLTNLAHNLSSILFLSAYAEASNKEEGTPKADEVEMMDRGGSDKTERQRVVGAQWMLLGAFLDRVALIVCFIVILIVLGRFSIVI